MKKLIILFGAACCCISSFAQIPFVSEVQNLNNNLTPANWTFGTILGSGNISNGKLNSLTVNGSVYLERKGTVPQQTDSLVIEWDASIRSTYWGGRNYAAVTIGKSIIDFWQEYNKATLGDENKSFIHVDGKAIATDSDPTDFSDFHHKVIFTSNLIVYVTKRISDGVIVHSHKIDPFDHMPNYRIADISVIQFHTQTTTGSALWLDNPSIRIVKSTSQIENSNAKSGSNTILKNITTDTRYGPYDYDGETKNGIPNGYGTSTFKIGEKAGDQYTGYWVDGYFEGKGTYKFATGNHSTYTGDFVHGLREGQGTATVGIPGTSLSGLSGSTKYVGAYHDGFRSGFGRCYDAEGALIYEGNFDKGKPTETYPNRPESTTMVIKVTNRNVSSGDAPTVSPKSDGTNGVKVPLNGTAEFTIDKSSPYLYLWTCDGKCLWKEFVTPKTIGDSIEYNVSDPNSRKLTFTRVK